jgi:LPS sulfotransferase NodH
VDPRGANALLAGRRQSSTGAQPRFAFEQIHTLVQTIDEHNAAWRNWFATFGLQPHLVRYEDLVADPAGVTRGILDLLRLDPPADRVIAPGTRRQAEQLNHDWIALYRAIADCREP